MSRVDIPLLDAAEIAHVLHRVLPDAVPLPTLAPAPRSARRRALVRGGFVGTVVGLTALVVLSGGGALAVLLVPIGAGIGTSWGAAAYRGLGAAIAGVDGTIVHGRAGALTRHHSIVPAPRVQSVAVESTLFQRRRRLATTRLDLSGAFVDLIDRDQAEAETLASAAIRSKTGGAPAAAGAPPRSI